MQKVDAEGPLSPAEVWERYTHASLWSSWAPQVRGVSGAHDPVRAGDRGWVRGPFPLRLPYTVLAVDEGARRWSWQVGIGVVSVVMEHGVDPAPAGSRAWLRIEVPGPLAAPYAPIARMALRRLVRP
ncbi:SRPBCC family protein [Nocardioides euryhalodurans]|uniref:SRPBCC family protein n=1 Tax=Nocardioides euryhalodurans TaxID=2518370 RepID=A0A4P7GJS1_9ACTN|nr:SRPBCC family protein [Nocardioides euryhalodurans]QBR92246.1 SRPBCC family protein [Nocardioides euryhalodurans]